MGGVILRAGYKYEPRARVSEFDDLLGQSADRNLVRISKVNRSDEVGPGIHEQNQAINQIANEAE